MRIINALNDKGKNLKTFFELNIFNSTVNFVFNIFSLTLCAPPLPNAFLHGIFNFHTMTVGIHIF